MKIKTKDLTDDALDYAVAKIEGALSAEYGLTDDERYSTDWSQGGPIIEREFINIENPRGLDWQASMWIKEVTSSFALGSGPTALVAAMRCYVSAKLGKEIEIPDELIK